jgi:hypothetical protein
MKLLLLLPIMLIGACTIMWEGERAPIPTTAKELKVAIAESESDLKSLEEELVEDKKAVETRTKDLEQSEGYFTKSDARSSLQSAEHDVDFTMFRIKNERAYLQKLKAKLEGLGQE